MKNVVVRKKMYKAKKNWVIASVAGAAVLTVQLQHQDAHAATVGNNTTGSVTTTSKDAMGAVHHAQNQLSQAVQQASQAGVKVTSGASQVVKTPSEAMQNMQSQAQVLHSQASQAQSMQTSYAKANSQYQQASMANNHAWSQYRDDVNKVNQANSQAMAKHDQAVASAAKQNSAIASANAQKQGSYRAALTSAENQNSQVIVHNSQALSSYASAVNKVNQANQQIDHDNAQAQQHYQQQLTSAENQNSQIEAHNSQALSSYASAANSVVADNNKIAAQNSAANSQYQHDLASAVAKNTAITNANSQAMSAYNQKVADVNSQNAQIMAHNQAQATSYHNAVTSVANHNASLAVAQASYAKVAASVAAENKQITAANDKAMSSYQSQLSDYNKQSQAYVDDKKAYDSWTKATGINPSEIPMTNKNGATSWQINGTNTLNISNNQAPNATCQVSGFDGAKIVKVPGKDLMFNGDSTYGYNITYPKEQNYNGVLGTVTYTNIGNEIKYRGRPISKLVYTFSNLQSNPDEWHSTPGLTIYNDPANGIDVNKGSVSVTIQMYDSNGNLINLKDAYLFFGSINSWWNVNNADHPNLAPAKDTENSSGQFIGSPYGGTVNNPGKHVEYVKSDNDSQVIAIQGSDVQIHNGNMAYPDATIAGEIVANGKTVHWDQEGTPGEVIGGVVLGLNGTNPTFTFGSMSSNNDGISGMWTPISTTLPASNPKHFEMIPPTKPTLTPLVTAPQAPTGQIVKAPSAVTPTPLVAMPAKPTLMKPVALPTPPKHLADEQMPTKPTLTPLVSLPKAPTLQPHQAMPDKPTLEKPVALPTAPTLQQPVSVPAAPALTPLPKAPQPFTDQAPSKPATIDGTYHNVTVANPTIVIHYVDDTTGKELAPSITITGTYGTPYQGEQKSFKDYQYKDVTGLPTSGKLTQDGQITYHYVGERNVVVHYVDQNGKEIAPSTTTTQAIGSKYNTSPKNIPGYQYHNESGSPASGTVGDNGANIYYHYNEPSKVTVHYVDQNGKEIAPSKVIAGNVGDKYQTSYPDVPGYQYHNETGLPTDGTLPKQGGDVYYHYNQQGKVTVHYVDQNGKEIVPSKVIAGNVGDPYVTVHPDINGYHYQSESGDLPSGKLPVSGNVYYHYNQQGKVTVHYVDQNGKEIAPSTVVDGTVGSKYNTSPKDIPGYQYHNESGLPASGTITQQGGDVYYHYDQPSKVTVHYVDQSGKEIAPVTTDHGNVGTPYHTQPATITGYHMVKVVGNANGDYQQQPQVVTYVYEKTTVAKPVATQPDKPVATQSVTVQPAATKQAVVVPEVVQPQQTVAQLQVQPQPVATAVTPHTAVPQATITPVASLPQTGDQHDSMTDWAVLALLAGASLAGIGLASNDRKDNKTK